MKLAFFLLLALCCQNSFAFDLYILALQWPKAYFNVYRKRCAKRAPLQFTIHGLWPTMNSSAPLTCRGIPSTVPFDVNQVRRNKDLYGYMLGNWPGLTYRGRYGEVKLWGHEWNKHGTCSGLDHQGYFEKTCELTNCLYSFTSAHVKLSRHGVSHGTAYTQKEFREDVEGVWNLHTIIVCNKE